MVGSTKICAMVNRSFNYQLHSLTVPRNTLLDGELLGDVFIVHDAVIIAGEDVRKMILTDRLARVAALCNIIVPNKIRVVCKQMYPLEMISRVNMSGSHVDGLIFTPVNEHVRLGTHRTLFKWKEKHTVDFIVKNKFLCVQNASVLMEIQPIEDTENGKILECVFTSEKLWKPIITRRDKHHPNNLRTLDRTLINISENITFDELKRTFGGGASKV
jgi:hypothetical protein